MPSKLWEKLIREVDEAIERYSKDHGVTTENVDTITIEKVRKIEGYLGPFLKKSHGMLPLTDGTILQLLSKDQYDSLPMGTKLIKLSGEHCIKTPSLKPIAGKLGDALGYLPIGIEFTEDHVDAQVN